MQRPEGSALATAINLKGGCVAATAIIWGCSTGMLTIDLLFAANAQSEMVIASAIFTAAAVSTMTVWLSARKAPATSEPTGGKNQDNSDDPDGASDFNPT